MKKSIELILLVITSVAAFFLLRNLYNDYMFHKKPLPQSYLNEIKLVENEILNNMQREFGYQIKFPIIITDKIPGKIYGVTSHDKYGNIKIYLNKKIMKESFSYILSDVIAHEYAHAFLFHGNYYANGGEGHSDIWKQTCDKLGGANCRRYVDSHDVIMNKLPF